MNAMMRSSCSVICALFLVVFGVGCGSSGSAGVSEDDFTHVVGATELQARIDALKALIPESVYNTITAGSRDNAACRESNREELGLPDTPNSQWYYTYDNLIAGMAELEDFAGEGDENTRKLEIAAFLANVAQETGAHGTDDPYGGPGCFIQERDAYGSQGYNSRACGVSYTCAAAGYFGRGPHQLSWDTNYASFGETMGVGLEYVTNPDTLTTDPEIGIAGSIWFWGHEELNADWPPTIPYKPSAHNVLVGEWTPTEYDEACGRTTANLGVITNIINGGLECGTRASAEGRTNAANRVRFFEAITTAMGVTVPAGWADDCTGQKDFEECPSYRSPTSRCGFSWSDAQSKCGTFCATDSDCSGEESCYGQLDSHPCPGGS